MHDGIEIRYYREKDVFYSEKKELINYMYYVPNFITSILGIDSDFVRTDICHPYSDEEDIFDYNSLKKDEKYLKDKIIIVALIDDKVIGISIFSKFAKFIYLKLFCIEKHHRKSGFSTHFLNISINMIREDIKMPILLISTEEGHNLYKRHGFLDIKYKVIKKIDTGEYLKWIKYSYGKSIGKYLMVLKYIDPKKIKRLSKKFGRLL